MVRGPVALRVPRFRTRQQKGFDPVNPFYINIEVEKLRTGGFRATVEARAIDEQLARRAAVFFLGRALDVLAFRLDLPLFVSLTDQEPRSAASRHETRRRIKPQEIEDAFWAADELEMTQPPFLTSLSWYRKGLYTEDPLDQYKAYWIAIERVASSYYAVVDGAAQKKASRGTRIGIKMRVSACFSALWGPLERWPSHVPKESSWVNDTCDVRNDIAHGNKPVTIDTVASVVEKLDTLKRVAHTFLSDWSHTFLAQRWVAPSEGQSDSDEEPLTY